MGLRTFIDNIKFLISYKTKPSLTILEKEELLGMWGTLMETGCLQLQEYYKGFFYPKGVSRIIINYNDKTKKLILNGEVVTPERAEEFMLKNIRRKAKDNTVVGHVERLRRDTEDHRRAYDDLTR